LAPHGWGNPAGRMCVWAHACQPCTPHLNRAGRRELTFWEMAQPTRSAAGATAERPGASGGGDGGDGVEFGQRGRGAAAGDAPLCAVRAGGVRGARGQLAAVLPSAVQPHRRHRRRRRVVRDDVAPDGLRARAEDACGPRLGCDTVAAQPEPGALAATRGIVEQVEVEVERREQTGEDGVLRALCRCQSADSRFLFVVT